MPVFALSDEYLFPDPNLAHESGVLAVGGDFHPKRLLLAYAMGIFPWPTQDMPILWHSPDPRMVLFPERLKLSRSLRQTLRKRPFRLTMDTAFLDVMRACASVPRPGQDGTWITDEMYEGYTTLHERGLAHSVEVWDGDALVGGLYGISLGSAFFGESMFAKASNASKVAFAKFVEQLVRWEFRVIDCQVYTAHLARFGAEEIPRTEFLQLLAQARDEVTRQGRWTFDDDLAPR